MATNRPNFIDLGLESRPPPRSPRVHVAGDVPPALSPLDAVAMQSRMLAKQLLEETSRSGSRVDRLPPLSTASPLMLQARSDYFRSISNDTSPDGRHAPPPTTPQGPVSGLGLRTAEVQDAFAGVDNRPVSVHPRMSRIPPTPDETESRGRTLRRIDESEPSFGGARREQSPGSLHHDGSPGPTPAQWASTFNPVAAADAATAHMPSLLQREKEQPNDSATASAGLIPPPPRALFPRRSSSIISTPLDPTDETGAMVSSFHSLPPPSRKPSASSVAISSAAVTGSFNRSPSVGSESSTAPPRPPFNFSRPMSRSGNPGLELLPSRQASSDSHPSYADMEAMSTPISTNSDAAFDDAVVTAAAAAAAASSYIYSKFDLPRGRTIRRSVPPPDPLSQSEARPTQPSPPPPQPSPDLGSPPAGGGRFSEDTARGRPRTSPQQQPQQQLQQQQQQQHERPRLMTAVSAVTSDTVSTLKASRSQRSFGPSVSDTSAEEHLAKGIKCHEEGSIKQSTYHLRHAARMGNPTAMLLYALACRHGWGMRSNQAEGVQWLRKAAESASVEIADDEGLVKEGKFVDATDRKTRKAQFALSIYELGVSHMNGWGVEQDKALALRCFEIAGSWGDGDALTEAGFCYAKGIGCKKDLKKSAQFYRAAEAKGMIMPGNSWIHKEKYNDDGDKKKKKSRSKSRTRTIFGK